MKVFGGEERKNRVLMFMDFTFFPGDKWIINKNINSRYYKCQVQPGHQKEMSKSSEYHFQIAMVYSNLLT